MKKSISLLLAVVMIVSMLPMAVFAESDPAIVFSTDFDNDLEIGDTFTVTAEMSNNPGIAAVKLSLGWNENAVQFNGFAKKGNRLDSEALAYMSPVYNDADGIITVGTTYDFTDNGKLFTANFTIVGEGSLDITLKQSDTETLYEMKNAAGVDVNFNINLSALNGLTVGGKPVGPAIPDDAPFTAITTDAGAVLAIEDMGTLIVDACGNGDEEVPYYHIAIPEGANETYIRFDLPLTDFMEQNWMTQNGLGIGSSYTVVNSEDKETGMAELEYLETSDDYTIITIPTSFVAMDSSFSPSELSALKIFDEENEEYALYYAVGPQDASANTIAVFSLEFAADGGAETYSITIDEDMVGGTLKVEDENRDPINEAAAGESVYVTVVPNEGYSGNAYTINGEIANDFLFQMPAKDVVLSAVFTAIDYKVNVTQPDNGTVTADPTTATINTEVTLTATPNEGYEFVSYNVMCGEAPVEVTNGKFNMPAGNVTVTAEFTAETLYDITVTQPEGGSVSTDPVAQAKAGASVTVNAVAEEGYELEAIYVNGEEISSNTFEMPENDVVVTAKFSLKEYGITVTQPVNGTVTADPTTATMGETVTLSYAAKEGYKFSGYTVMCGDDQVVVTDGKFTMPAGDVTVTAVFAKKSEGYTFAVSSDGSANNGETAVVKVVLTGHSDANVTGYNAYDITLNYDSSKLEYVSASGAVETDNGQVEVYGDTIHIVGCGAFKTFAEKDVVAAITFRVKPEAQGSANVTIEKVQVSDSEDATMPDMTDIPMASPEHAEGDAEADGTPDISVIVVPYTVEKPAFIVGADKVLPGKNYTFSFETNENYDYALTGITVGGVAIELPEAVDGAYTVANVNGAVVITATRVGKSYDVTYEGEAKFEGNEKATYGTDYTFTLTPSKEYMKIASVVVTYVDGTEVNYAKDGSTYKIAGNLIVGQIKITVTEDNRETAVKFEGVEAAEVVGGLDQTAYAGKDFTFKLNKDAKYDYTVKVGETELTETDGVYTIPANKMVAGEVTVTIKKEAKDLAAVEVREYFDVEGKSMFLVTAKWHEFVLTYNGEAMYYSDKYKVGNEAGAYCWLVLSDKSADDVKAEAEAAIAAADEAVTAVSISYSGDVNATTKVDVNDAQLVYDMYNGYYSNFNENITMKKFLEADMTNDGTLGTQDVANIISIIINNAKTAAIGN